MTTPNPFRIEVVAPTEIPTFAPLINASFAHFPIETTLQNTLSTAHLHATGLRHLRAYNDHLSETGQQSAIRCMVADPETGRDVMAACAFWYIYPTPRPEEDLQKPNHLLSADWVPEEEGQRDSVRRQLASTLEARKKWLRGRGHAILMYMATEPAWRRKGAATAVVKWGLERCREFGVPAFLEASEEGRPVYERLGFAVVDEVVVEDDDGVGSQFPVMMWWPDKTKEEDKRPLG